MDKRLVSSRLFFIFVSFFTCTLAQELYLPYSFQSFDGDNLLTYKNPNTYYSESIFTVCTDQSLAITCFYTEPAQIICTPFTGSSIVEAIPLDLPNNSDINSLISYNYKKTSLLYYNGGSIYSTNLASNFTQIMISDVDCASQSCQLATSEQNNGDIFYFKQGTTLQSRNFTSNGAVIGTTDLLTPYYFQLFDYDDSIAVGPIIDEDNNYGYALLDTVSLDTICLSNVFESMNGFYGNNKYIVMFTDGNLYTYVQNCTGSWRLPVDNYPSIFATFDWNNNFYFAYQKYNENYALVTNVAQVSLSKQPQTLTLPYITLQNSAMFAGVDNTSTVYFSNGTSSSMKILGFAYDSWKNKTSVELEVDIASGAIDSFPISIIPGGIQVIVGAYGYNNGEDPWQGILSIVSESNEWWKITSIFTYVFLPLSFIFSIGIMIKHLLRGEDGKGWKKAKIFDILNSLLIIIGIIFITVVTCAAQVQIVANINSNTVPFDNDLGGFYSNYLENSCTITNTSTTTTPIGLCTCTDTQSQYQTGTPCKQSGCDNSYDGTCSDYLQSNCDCYHSVYKWECTNCNYQFNSSCTVDLTNTQSYTNLANQQWELCQKYYATPTKILNVNFYVLICSAVILVILNFIQIILKYDSPLFDLILTVSSIVSAFLQFLLILTGTIYVSLNANSDCVTSTLNDLPGCQLISSDILSMESLSTTYLENAYRNLYASPAIFIISAIPDLLSLFVCMGCYRWYRISKGYETIEDSRRDACSFIVINITIFILAIVAILIFFAAAALFFTASVCSSGGRSCDINPVILNWFFVIGAIPGSIVTCCVCCCCCIVIMASQRKN